MGRIVPRVSLDVKIPGVYYLDVEILCIEGGCNEAL
jgi:hypothetical protein